MIFPVNPSLTPDVLDADAIRAGLAGHGEALAVEVRERCGSTNTELLSRDGAPGPALLLTEEQTAGRGRRGRRWHASPGSALMFSLRWDFAGPVTRLRGLSLAVGVGLAHALRSLGAAEVALKWPNDLLSGESKLGGVLIETRSSAGRVVAVLGVGINYHPQAGLDARLGRSIAALSGLIDPLPARNAIAVRLVAELIRSLRAFDARGLDAFRNAWEAMHAQQGTRMRVRTANGRIVAGIAEGIAADGALMLRNRRGLRCVSSGTVMRAEAA